MEITLVVSLAVGILGTVTADIFGWRRGWKERGEYELHEHKKT